MSFFPNVLNLFYNQAAKPVPDYPRPQFQTKSQVNLKLNRVILRPNLKFASAINTAPGYGLIAFFMIYPALTERFKYRVGLPNTYTPIAGEDLSQ